MSDYQTVIQNIFYQANFIRELGIELVELGEGVCVTRMPILPKHQQQDGFVHAGVQATIADHTAGTAAATLAPQGANVLSIEFKINLLRPALGDLLECRAQLLKPGRTVSVVESELFAIQGDSRKMVSKATVTIAVVQPK